MISIVRPNAEFLTVFHSYLNGNDLCFRRAVDTALQLQPYLHGRQVIPCFEGDVLQVPSGEIVLTHQSFREISEEKYKKLRDVGIATSLDEVLDKYQAFKENNPLQRVIIALELKSITTDETIDKTIKKLHDRKITDVYFDSFFGGRLDVVDKINKKYGTNYIRSLHLIAQFGSQYLMMSRAKNGQEVYTVPYKMSLGIPRDFTIYGAVGSIKNLERVVDDEKVIGAYTRFKEKGPLTMLWNSVTNKAHLRRHFVLLPFVLPGMITSSRMQYPIPEKEVCAEISCENAERSLILS